MLFDYFDDKEIKEALEEAHYLAKEFFDTGFSVAAEYKRLHKKCLDYYEKGLYDSRELLVSELTKQALAVLTIDRFI